MIGRLRFVGVVAVCLAMVAVVPVTAQQVGGEQDLTASPLSVYTPPTCVPGVPFSDITCTTGFDPWIEQFGLDGITAGCGGGKYCPGTPVTRDQMAVFIEKSMRGTANWPPHTVLVVHHPAAETNSNLNSGTELLAMVAAIPTSGAEAPGPGNPWLIKLGPGVFDLGSNSLTLPQYTALEGSGQDVTEITATGYAVSAGTVIMGDHGRLSRITVNNSGGSSNETAVYLPGSAGNVALEHVTLTASSPSNASGGAAGLSADLISSFSMVDCDVTVHGAAYNYGILANTSAYRPRLDGVRVNVYGSNDTSGSSYGYVGISSGGWITNSYFNVQDGSTGYGVDVYGATSYVLFLQNSEVTTFSSGAAVYAHDTAASLVGDLINSLGGSGLDTGGGTASATIQNCNIFGASHWLSNASGYQVMAMLSTLIGGTSNAGTLQCFGNSTGAGFLTNTCP